MNKEQWIQKCQRLKAKWSVFQEQGDKLNDDSNGLNFYKFIEVLNKNLKDDSVIVSDAGSSLYICGQALKLNGKNQRWICSWAQAEMGAAIPMSCGVSYAKNKQEVLVVIGDGSLNTQVHSLALVKKHNLPIKIFILNNSGYLSIKNSQDKFYEGRRLGTSSNDGYFFPEIRKIAASYELGYLKIDSIYNLDRVIKQAMNLNEPCIIEVICCEIQDISPVITASKNKKGEWEQNDFSNMYPFLSKEKYDNEMIKN